MIGRAQVIDILLEACPSYRARWDAYQRAPEFDADLLYVQLGDFADHVVDLLARGELAEVPATAGAIERLHVEGDDGVKEAATIGLLEGIQNVAGHRGVATRILEDALGIESRHWWKGLDAFWSGKTPHVGADVAKPRR